LAYRTLNLTFSRKVYLGVVGLPVGLIGIYYLFNHFFGSGSQLILPYFIAGIVLAYLLGIFKINDLKTVLSK
jgi:hypothetical protein